MLTIFNIPQKETSLMQTSWAATLNPVIALPWNSGILIDATLGVGQNIINHKLGRKLQGWIVVRKTAAASIYDSQNTNANPDVTLVLFSDSACTIKLLVF